MNNNFGNIDNYQSSFEYEIDRDYWNNHILDIGDYVKFHNVKSNNYKNVRISFNEESLSNILEDNEISQFNFMVAVFSLYLSRIDRTKGCLLKTILPTNNGGFDKNTLLKIEYIKDYSFTDYLNEIKEVYNLATEHTKVDVEEYVGDELSYYSIFDFSHMEHASNLNEECSALTLNVFNDYLELMYNSDLFSDIYIQHMAENLEFLIENIVNSPNQFLKDIDILSSNEHVLLADFCKGEIMGVDDEKLLSKTFREHAISYPDIIAIDDGVNQVSYGDLEKSTNSIAHDLHENYNVGLGSRVALMLPRNYHFPELVLALNKIGAIFIPIDLLYPNKRIEYMLTISQAEFIVTTRDIEDRCGFGIDVICIEDLDDDNDVDIDITCNGEDLFSIMFTSGTEGLPKGVMVSNKQMTGIYVSLENIFNFAQGEVVGCYLSFSFIASFLIYATLLFGGCCRIFNENEQMDVLSLIKTLKETPMNSLILPPSVAIPIFENEELKLKYMVLAGAKLVNITNKERYTKLVNVYGTTEIIFGITKIYDSINFKLNHTPLGRPLTNTWVYILDESCNQMPIGVPGEICISNDYMSPGYYNDSELTNERFVVNPYSDCNENKRMYRTGDLGFYNFEGEIEIIGREDDQLSVRGFRIESGEILSVIKRFNEISEVYLDVEHDNLIAYYAVDSDFNVDEVKEALKMELPYYMVPSLFIELDEIPLTPLGKIDKSVIKNTFNKTSNINIEDEILSVVMDAFKEVLNHDFVLMDDDFVELGGNSLSAMNLQLLLKERLDVYLSSNKIIELSTPFNISNHIKYGLNQVNVNYTFEDSCPLSESQLNVYLDESINELATNYNNPLKIEFRDDYSIDEIKCVLVKLFDIYPILSARIYDNSLCFDGVPEIREGDVDDMELFVQPFELDKSLSRFLIVPNGKFNILCLDVHHLIFDGTSISIFLNKLLEMLEGREVDFIDDGILRQVSFEESIDSQYLDDAECFFDGMFANQDETLELLPSVHVGDSSNYRFIDEFHIDEDYMNSFLMKHHITHNQFFSSVFAYTLSRFTGSSKVLFNLIGDGRGHIDLSDSVGMFVRTLPLIFDCSNQSVESFMEYSKGLITSVTKYDLYPFHVLANKYDLTSNIFFQYAHNIFNNPSNHKVWELKHDLIGDFSFFIFNSKDNNLGIRILYSRNYSDEFVERFAESYKLILQEMIRVAKLSDINFTTNDDLKLLDNYNQTEADWLYDDVLEGFNDSLSKYPNNNLVSYDGKCYSYAEGAFIADKIAKRLIDFGVSSQDCVAFLIERCEKYMFAALGILSVGAAYVPLDDAYPDERLKFMINDSNAKVVIVTDDTCQRAANLADDSIIFNISDILNGEICELFSLNNVIGDLACILYTSGTTGIPKGVKITRKGVNSFICSQVEYSNMGANDVFGMFGSIGFDAAAIRGICEPIMYGACVDIVPWDIRLDLDKLNRHFIENNVTHTSMPTQVAKLFVNEVDNTSLKILVTGGEKLGEILKYPDYTFIDAYGPTECTVSICSIEEKNKSHFSSIGHLYDNVKAYVLDNEFRRVPIGAVGELCIAGNCVSDGYLNREDETLRAFVENPFENGEYGILYRTGDLARVLSDGSFALVGRQDSQVKIRGNRVELSEIEIVIRKIDFVDDVSVQTVKLDSNYELVAYVTLNDELDDETLKDYVCSYVGERKPDYMVPSFVVKLDSIPLNVNGKVDRSALPEIDVDALHAEYVAPTTKTEKDIVDAFEVVFNQKGLGLNDDFTRLGGDSIAAIRVVSLLEKKGISSTARDILKYKTPYIIAHNVSENVENVSYDAVEGIVDMLPIQSYFFDEINRDDFTQQFVLKAKDELDIGILQKSFDELTNVHDMLRAIYRFGDDNNPVQEILPVNTRICEINEYSISGNFNESLKEIVASSIGSINMLNKLIDINLVHCDGECYLVMVIHHLIVDGVSWNILLSDLADIYFKLIAGEEIGLARPYPYKNWVDDVKSLVKNMSDEEKRHWVEVNGLLKDSNIKGPSNTFNFNVSVKYYFDELLRLSEEEFWALAISRAYKKTYGEDIILNRESYGRDENIANLNRTIGWFTTQYPVIVESNAARDDISLMSDVHNLKKAFNDVNHLGLNYSSLIYAMDEFEFKHCPVTFNFLSREFEFENKLFKSDNQYLFEIDEINARESFGISVNVSFIDDSYVVFGDYAGGTYIANLFDSFMDNLKSELEFLANAEFKNVVCPLSESQLGVYLDEKINDKGTAYSTFGIFECNDYSIDEIRDAICAVIDRHPILRGRVLDTGDLPLLVCDGNPLVEAVHNEDYYSLVRPFDLDKSLARFFIVDNDTARFVFYDMHHIISDASTTSIVGKELNDALKGMLNSDVDLGFVHSSYESFDSKFKSDYQSAHEFFAEQLASIDEVQELMEDIDGHEGYVCLPIRGIRKDVEEYAYENDITIANLLNAVFAYTYSRFTGNDKVQFNFTEHGRHDEYTANSVGMFVRTIPILADCKNDSIKNYLGNFSDLALDSMLNDVYPFRLLATEFNLNNNVIFEYNYDLNDVSHIKDDIIVSTDIIGSVAEFACLINDLDDGYVINIDHSDKYSNDTCIRFARAYEEILSQMLVKENLADIDFTSPEDINLLDSYNKTEHDFDNRDILDAFNNNLEKYENNPLVGYGATNYYTHGQAASIANEVANKLSDLGVSRQDYVSLFLNRSEWFLLASMGVLSHGTIYVPIETTYPDERIILMLKDVCSSVVIVDDDSEQRICNIIIDNDLDVDVLNISCIVECDVSSSNHLNAVEVDGEDIACVLYTSGTTGVPKGIPITRKAVNNFVSWYVMETGFTSEDVYGMHCSYVFDLHTVALFAPIIAGGSLYVVPEDIRLDLKALNDFYVEHGCTHTYITSQLGKLFAESGMKTTIKLLCFGGMKLGELNAPDAIGPFETYGPSENLAVSTSIFANERIHSSSIGRFISNVKGYVLDGEHRRVPIGAVGELYLSGAQLTPGYLNRDDETDKSFFDNPFDGEEGYEHIYGTGDIVRFLPDGTLSIVGRRDGQVKIRGNRVELAEVESAIRNMGLMEDVTVQCTDDNELVAYVVVCDDVGSNGLRDMVCDYVYEHKPSYMVPSFVIRLDRIPLTVNGKVDKGALPEVDVSGLRSEYVLPTTETEKEIVGAFEKVFNQENIGIHDDFIRLGGDSLMAVKLLTYLDNSNISAADILSLRTPFNIAGTVNRVSFDLDMYSLDGGCPLNEPQLNVYLDIVTNNKVNAYLIPFSMEISNEYSIEEVYDALDAILNAHPILGMCVSDDFETPYLVKGSKPAISVGSDIDEEFLTKPFDLYDSLCRFSIVENDEGYLLYAIFHHIIFDALSDGVFRHDLQTILEGGAIAIDDSFLKVSTFSQKIRCADEYGEAHDFYDSMLADRDEAGVLLDSVLPDNSGISSLDLELDSKSFKLFLDECGISENVAFTGVFAYALSRFTGGNKALFNIIENGRDRFNNFHSIGMYVNTLPLLVDCADCDIPSFMGNISDLVYNAMKYNYYPFRLLANEYDINSDILFQFMPDWINDKTAKNSIYLGIGDAMDLISDFAVNVIRDGEKYDLTIVYSGKYSNDFIQSFMKSYKLILHEIISADKLSDIHYVSKADLELLDDINKTEHPLKYVDVLDAFNDNLADYPDNELVSYKGRSYTYAEGAYISDKIARKLIELGVKSQDCVSFLVERSGLYMFCVLGILSMGAVYVPLDDTLPDERIKFMLNDTQSGFVIVSDETYERARNLTDDEVLINISDILREDIGILTDLPVVHGDLACMLYTSGSTGVPKGVKITRKSILNISQYYEDTYGFSSDDVYGLYASIGFDVASFGIFASLYVGACLSVVPGDIRLEMSELNRYYINQGIKHTVMTTQVAKLFIDHIDETSLEVLLTGGEKLGEFVGPDEFTLVDVYGPTESFMFVNSVVVDEKIDYSSVGPLNYNVKTYILDTEGRRVPFGAVGELYIAGYQVAEGYLNGDEENAHAFIKNPFNNSNDYSLLYRTGDFVRFLPDGSLGIVGRQDGQVKIRGNRVELHEVEDKIRELDYIDDVTVQTVKNGNNNELVAYVVASEDMDDDILRNNIQSYVGDSKPDYMVPSFVISLDSIPLTVNGKVDKRALPEVDWDSLYAEYAAPTNETEKEIINAFEVAFNQKGIGLNDDFVRLGGDSIIAIRVVSLLEKKGISSAAGDILKYKTPYLIAQHADENAEKISYASVEGIVDLLPIQRYFFDDVNRNDFTQQFVLKAKDKLDINILQKAIDELTDVHDMLRTIYRFDENNNPVQEILSVNTRICEINEHAIGDNLDKNIEDILMDSISSINIENNLMNADLLNYGDESYLILVVHHLIVDGVSWNSMLSDLTDIYLKLNAGDEINISRPYPYKNWVGDVKQLVEDISDEEKQHWSKVNGLLDDSKIKGPAKAFDFKVDANYDSDNLLMLSEEEFLAFAISRAYKKTYGRDIIFNRESHGRDENLNRSVGWFTTQYPVSVKVDIGHDDISLMKGVYNLKTSFNDINHLGLNYLSLIYTTDELEFKHSPVTFNFLSREFEFKNELFKSINQNLSKMDRGEVIESVHDSYGISLNIFTIDDSYIVAGDYAEGTYIAEEFDKFIVNIKGELEFIGNYEFDNIVCELSEPQLGVYLDEKVNDKGTAYSAPGIFECSGYSIDEIEGAVHAVIDKHPILNGRVLETGNVPFLICDTEPSIEIIYDDDYYRLIRPFDLDKSLARFFIVDNDDGKFVFYDIHHIINDATSRKIINMELDLALKGKLDDAVDLGFVYASLDSFNSKFENAYDDAHEFFKNNLANIEETNPLLGEANGSVNLISIPIHNIREDIDAFCQELGITKGSLFNAIFAYVLSRFVGSDEVYYTFTEHGRHENYCRDALGMYVRTIPLIVDCANREVKDYLSYVSDLILNSMKYSDYPFRLLAKEFDLTNDITFEYNSDLNEVCDIEGLVIEDNRIASVSDFLCVINDLDDGYLIKVESCDRYSDETVIRFLNVFEEVLTQTLNKKQLKDIDYVASDDLAILDSINDTDHSLEYGDILEAFNDNLTKFPDSNLVSMYNNTYTYAQGASIANEIAKKLTAEGIGLQDCVAFLVDRSEAYMFAVLGILSIGAVYVPLDDTHPDKRIQFILGDSDAKVVVVTDETLERVKTLDKDLNILNISDVLKEEMESIDCLPVAYGDLACILYTSGTTGNPKGVKVTRKSCINVSSYYADKYNLTNDDIYGLYASIGFDAASLAILTTIYAGASLSIIPADIRLDMNKLNDYFIKYGITQTFITTQVGKLFAQSVDETSLDVLVVGGEKLGEFESPDDYDFIDIYGPTEAFVFVASFNNAEKIDSSSVGDLIYNTKAYILDEEKRKVPVGAVGELYLAGYQISEGYLNRPDEKAFIDFNPFEDDDDYSRLYRTGDMVRLLPDKTMAVVGRRDSQVKIRGNRVELSEVEAVIREIDYVNDVAVKTVKSGDNYELVAYVVVSSVLEGDCLRDAIQNYVGDSKPSYMVPSHVIKLDEIPLNVNGKVDKNALPDVDLDSLHAEYVPPTTQMEMDIVEAFEKVFNREKIGIYDDFISLGGDSLAAIKLLYYLEDYDISMADVLSLRTPSAIAGINDVDLDLDIFSLDTGCPLNTAQLNVYADITIRNKVDSYKISFQMDISKKHSLDAVINAVEEMVDVHPILGMCLSNNHDIPYLVKGPKPSISVESGVDAKGIMDFFTQPFDLYDSLSRFLIAENDDYYVLFAVFHHIIFDAVSLSVFKKDLQTILDGGVVSVDESFLKVAAFHHQLKNTERFVEASDFYDSMMQNIGDAGVLSEDSSSEGYGVSIFDLKFDHDAFKSFLDTAGVSENVLFTSVFAYTLSQFVDKNDVLFTIIENGRDRFNDYDSIGMNANVVPLLVDCRNRSISSFMKHMSSIIYGVIRYNYYPYTYVARKYDFTVSILFQYLPEWIFDSGGINENVDLTYSNNILKNFKDFITEFGAQLYQNGDDYSLMFLHSNNYSNEMIKRFAETYRLILSKIIHNDLSSNLDDIMADFAEHD